MLLSAVSCSDIRSSETLFKSIEKRYNGTWFTNIRFMLSIAKINNNGIEERATYRAEYVFPSQAIIKTDILNDNGYLFKNDTVISFKNGVAVSQRHGNNDFLWISMDIFNNSAKEIRESIGKMQIVDLEQFCTHTENDNKYYILGIPEYNDEYKNANQIWFDAKTLFPHKIQKTRDNHVLQLVYDNYIQVGGTGWIPQKITFKKDGQVNILEHLYDVSIPLYEKNNLTIDDFCHNETINERQLNPKSSFAINLVVEP